MKYNVSIKYICISEIHYHHDHIIVAYCSKHQSEHNQPEIVEHQYDEMISDIFVITVD